MVSRGFNLCLVPSFPQFPALRYEELFELLAGKARFEANQGIITPRTLVMGSADESYGVVDLLVNIHPMR